MEEQHLPCQVRSNLKTGKLSKVEIEGLKWQIKQLHVDSVEAEAGELDAAEEEIVIQSADNVLLQEVIARASGYVEDIGVIESESESGITKRLKELLKNPKNDPILSLRPADALRLKQETEEVNKATPSITLNNTSDFKNLIKAGANIVCERLGIRKSVKLQQEQFQKRSIESDIARLKKDLIHLDDWFKGKWKRDKKRKTEELKKKYGIQIEGFKVVIEELKQRISAKSEKLRRYHARGNQYRKNKLSRCNQKALHEVKDFWSELWDSHVPHKEDADWLKKVELELENVDIQDNVEITKEDVTKQLRKMAPGLDGIQGFWFKRFISQN